MTSACRCRWRRSTQQLVQGTISGGRDAEDFAVLLDQQAASAGLDLKPEAADVDDGLGSTS